MKKNLHLKSALLLLLAILFLVNRSNAQQILYVYNPAIIDETTGESPELPTMKLLEEQGYDVIPFTTFTISSATAVQLDSLNNADLIYIGRAVPSTNFQSPNKEIWHEISTPIITGNMWGLRNSRINWFNSADCSNINDSTAVVVADIWSDDPVFEGLEGTVDWWTGSYSTINIGDAGNGEVLATTSAEGYVVFARWEQGTEFYEGAGEEPAGERVFFGCGNDEMTNADGKKVWNYIGFTEDIKKVFFNEIARLLGVFEPQVGVEKFTNKLKPTIYPVPAQDFLVVEMNKLNKVDLIDLTGKNIATYTSNDQSLSIDVSKLNKGIYLLKICDKNGDSSIKKFTKE